MANLSFPLKERQNLARFNCAAVSCLVVLKDILKEAESWKFFAQVYNGFIPWTDVKGFFVQSKPLES